MLDNLKIAYIKLNNFKNVRNGEINFEVKDGLSNVIGIYGQNGSGKTAVIEALELFKALVKSKSLPPNAIDLIEYGEETAKIELGFMVHSSALEGNYKLVYYFEIGKRNEKSASNNFDLLSDSLDDIKESKENNSEDRFEKNKAIISMEKISIKKMDLGSKIKTPVIIDNTKEQMKFLNISPKPNFLKDVDIVTNLLLSKKLALKNSSSFLFQDETIETIKNIMENPNLTNKDKETIHDIYLTIILFTLIGNRISISSNSRNGYLFSNLALPLSYLLEDKNNNNLNARFIDLTLPIKGSHIVSDTHFILGESILDAINCVLPLIIPNLKIKIKVLNNEILENGKKGKRITLMSIRNNQELPFYSESDGIKKMVSILAGIIQIYNNKNNIFIVDEIDSGIFEFLLGELLSLISENAKGQLIFTSHNLRALEVLGYKNIVFTTTNTDKRYLRPKNIKESNNLRSAYIRGIQVDSFEEQLYKSSNKSRIKLSLLKSKKLIEVASEKIIAELIGEEK